MRAPGVYVEEPFDFTLVSNAPARPVDCSPEGHRRWTALLPFKNEDRFLGGIIENIAAQSETCELILIDNGSTDDSVNVARAACNRLGLRHTVVHEPHGGKVHALASGLPLVQTPFVATFDADTAYGPDYLKVASQIFEDPSCVAALAFYIRPDWPSWRQALAGLRLQALTRILPHQSHTGGAGQVFRTESLRLAGGFDPQRWSLILEDHEIVHRISRFGRVRADGNFHCLPARREKDFARTRWSLFERVLFHVTPAYLQDWFFYDFLAPRLRARSGCSPAYVRGTT